MPSITKQSPTNAKPRAKGGGVLDRIAPVRESEVGVRMCVYGRSKTGKTRLACTFPKPLLLIGAEDGTRSVTGVKGVDFVRLERSDEIASVAEMLKEGKYRTAALDTASSLYDMIINEIFNLKDGPRDPGAWGRASKDQWTQAVIQMKERLWSLLHVSELVPTNVLILAQEKNSVEDMPDGGELISPTVGAAVSASVARWLEASVDYICQTYIREQVAEEQIPGTKSMIVRPTGRKEYCLRVGPHPIFKTGFRLPPGGKGLPDALVDPDYTKVLKLIQGG